MRRIITLLLVVGLSLGIFSGCKSRSIRTTPLEEKMQSLGISNQELLTEEKEQSLVIPQQELLIVLGFVPLEDKRPKEDVSYMTSISKKVSEKILETLNNIHFFDEIHYPASADDVFIITGEIRKFQWESFDTMISYIPGLNVLPFFGLPSTRVESEVEIYLEIKNNKTQEVISSFSESYAKNRKYSIYSFKPKNAEADLAKCFDIVLNGIKGKISMKRNEILVAVLSAALEAAKKNKEIAVEKKPEIRIQETPKAEAAEETEIVVGSKVEKENEQAPKSEAAQATESVTTDKQKL